ncbi:MAG: TonB family protein [Endomicrobium sp.]|jgi:protein TonB|nr:TonB family protein [Endomicrobium sp.]
MRRKNEQLLYIALAASIGLHIAVWFFATRSEIKKDIKFASIPVEVSFYTPLPVRSDAPAAAEQKETVKQEEPKEEQTPVTKEDVVVKKKEKVKEKPKPKQKKAKPEEKPKKEEVKAEEVKPDLNNVETVQPAQNAEQNPEAAGSQYEALSFDSQNFKFPFYARQIRSRIDKNWHWADSYGTLRAVIYFRIHRDGGVSDITVKESSGDLSFDNNAQRSVRMSDPFAPLPDGYTEDSLGVHFEFKYR